MIDDWDDREQMERAEQALENARQDGAYWEREYFKESKRTEELVNALRALCDKLDMISSSPEYQGQASMAFAHGYVYAGPTWIEELLAARAALSGEDE